MTHDQVDAISNPTNSLNMKLCSLHRTGSIQEFVPTWMKKMLNGTYKRDYDPR